MNPIQCDLANLHDHYGPAFLAELALDAGYDLNQSARPVAAIMEASR